MKVNQVLETEQGAVTFQGELKGQELTVVIEAGLNYLMATGAIPFIAEKDRDPATYMHQPTDTAQ